MEMQTNKVAAVDRGLEGVVGVHRVGRKCLN